MRMQHLIDNHSAIVETFKNNPGFAFLVSIVGIGAGYGVQEAHISLIYMQLLQALAWIFATLAASIPVINTIRKELIPWIKSFKKKK